VTHSVAALINNAALYQPDPTELTALTYLLRGMNGDSERQ